MSATDEWDDLARLAEAATPGPWQRHPSGDGSLFGPDPGVIGQTWGLNWRNDIEFIAAANPATVLRLITAVRAALAAGRAETTTATTATTEDAARVEALALHLWDEGIVRPESVAREAVEAVLRWLAEDGLLATARTGSDEPPEPTVCEACEMTYEDCTKRVLARRGACCSSCRDTATHAQHAWEEWNRSGGDVT